MMIGMVHLRCKINKMKNIKKHILWADDEINSLKPHIIFLESKGYSVIGVNSGEDAIEVCKKSSIDLLLVDEMMTGLDGLSTIKIVKEKHPDIPIIMVTKNEEEWLMDEAIGEHIEDYLTKPVNPSQILIACKKVFENKSIQSNKALKDFISFFNTFDDANLNTINDWFSIYSKICNWSIQLDNVNDSNIMNMLKEQKYSLNKSFSNFVELNYKNWINNSNTDSPILSNQVFSKFVKPLISENKKLIFIIIDCLTLDQWKKISELLYPSYRIKEDFHLSILPSATPFARNAIFSGLLPNEIKNKLPEIWNNMYSSDKLNGSEDILFSKMLDRNNINKKFNYFKVSDYDEGTRFLNKINDYKKTDIITLVVNFVDILGHSRSESNILKELLPNDSSYRNAIFNWFEKSWLKESLDIFREWNADIVLTADHGNIQINKQVILKADQNVSSGIRYKYGRNLNVNNDNNIFKIRNPEEYSLPKFEINTEYAIAKNDSFFVYKNDYHKYVNIYKKTFQHGGISMDELIIPVVHLSKK